MSAISRLLASAPVVVGALVLACAPYAPAGWLPTPEEARSDAYGGWARLEYRTGNAGAVAQGELLAVAPDSVFVLGAGGFTALATARVTGVLVETYDPRAGGLSAWLLLGTLSTASNGFYLVLSAPLWLVLGGIGVGSAVGAARVSSAAPTPARWEALRAFARFPQGLPPGLDRTGLKPKTPRSMAAARAP